MPSPAAWLQAYQARVLNAGWRIQDIPFLPPGATLVVTGVPAIGWAMNACALAFLGFGVGLAALTLVDGPSADAWRGVLGGGLFGSIVGLGASVGLGRWTYARSLVRVDAVCIDREVRELPKLGRDTQPRWTGRIVCAYAFGGAEHIATPRLKGAPLDGFARFADEAAVHAFLDARIRPDGRCAVWVDPVRPLCASLADERR